MAFFLLVFFSRGYSLETPASCAAPGSVTVGKGIELIGTGEREGKPAGSLSSVVHDPGTDETLALGFTKRAFWKEGTELTADGTTFTVMGPARP